MQQVPSELQTRCQGQTTAILAQSQGSSSSTSLRTTQDRQDAQTQMQVAIRQAASSCLGLAQTCQQATRRRLGCPRAGQRLWQVMRWQLVRGAQSSWLGQSSVPSGLSGGCHAC